MAPATTSATPPHAAVEDIASVRLDCRLVIDRLGLLDPRDRHLAGRPRQAPRPAPNDAVRDGAAAALVARLGLGPDD